MLLGGRKISTFTRDNKQYDVIAQLSPEERATPSDMDGIYLRGRDGALIQLQAVTNIEEGAGVRELNHFNRIRSATLSAGLAPGFTLGEGLDSLNKLAREVLPRGSSHALTGESRELEESGSSLYFAFGLALVVVFMVLASQFESLIHPFTVLLAVPLAITGALLTLLVSKSTINLYSQIGMILLIGLVTKNSILLVEYSNQLREKGLTCSTRFVRRGESGSADPHDVGRHDHGGAADRPGARRRFHQPPTLGLFDRRRDFGLHHPDPVCGPRRLLPLRPAACSRKARHRRTRPGARARPCGGDPMIGLVLAVQLAVAPTMAVPGFVIAADDSIPVVTLAQALDRAVKLDPFYVRALGSVAEAEWSRKAARVAFLVPALTASLDYTKYSQAFFNIGTFNQSSTASTFQLGPATRSSAPGSSWTWGGPPPSWRGPRPPRYSNASWRRC